MRKILVLLALVLPSLISCGGGGGSPADAIQAASISASVLTSCINSPKSPDKLLTCLAGTLSHGTDASGASCSIKFSSNGLDIISLLLTRNVQYQPASASAQDMNYLFDRSYSSDTGALKFAVTVTNASAPYFNFGFTGNTKTGGGTALFDFTLAPDTAGAPPINLKCTVPL